MVYKSSKKSKKSKKSIKNRNIRGGGKLSMERLQKYLEEEDNKKILNIGEILDIYFYQNFRFDLDESILNFAKAEDEAKTLLDNLNNFLRTTEKRLMFVRGDHNTFPNLLTRLMQDFDRLDSAIYYAKKKDGKEGKEESFKPLNNIDIREKLQSLIYILIFRCNNPENKALLTQYLIEMIENKIYPYRNFEGED
jgi:hypothetical protein